MADNRRVASQGHVLLLSVPKALDLLNTAALIAVVLGALLLTGTPEYAVLHIGGVVLVVSGVASQRLKDAKSSPQETEPAAKSVGYSGYALLRDGSGILAFGAGLVGAYLIYFQDDGFARRKAYLLIVCITYGLFGMISWLADRTIDRRSRKLEMNPVKSEQKSNS